MAKYALIDTETTGLDASKHQTLEVGIIIFDDDMKIVDYGNYLVKHGEYVVSPKAMEINGIDLIEHEKQADTADVACEKIISLLERNHADEDGRYVFAGQNCAFDRKFMNALFESASAEDKAKWERLIGYHSLELQTLAMGAKLKGDIDIGRYNLDTIAAALNVPKVDVVVDGVENARHRALYDCLLELNCLQALSNKPLSKLTNNDKAVEVDATEDVIEGASENYANHWQDGRYAYTYEIDLYGVHTKNMDMQTAVSEYSNYIKENSSGIAELTMNVRDWKTGKTESVWLSAFNGGNLDIVSWNDIQELAYMQDKTFAASIESDYELIKAIPEVADKVKSEKKSRIINLFGGAGAGKSTAAMELTALLKKNGFVAEYVPEYAKELVWAGDMETLDGSLIHQKQIYEEQKARVARLMGKVDFIVTDSPIILNGVYMTEGTAEDKSSYMAEVVEKFKNLGDNQINLFVNRGDKPFEQEGRIHTYEQSVEVDNELRELLSLNDIEFVEINRDGGVMNVVEDLVSERREKEIAAVTISREWVEQNYHGESVFAIPEGVKYISEGAFYGCESLESITIPESVTSIGEGAFKGCKKLKEVVLPEGVTEIDDYAFEGCENLENVAIPNNVKWIGYNAFLGCERLESITIPESVTRIGANAFESCTALKSVTIPESVTSIGEGAFMGCTGLKNVKIDGVEIISTAAFSQCSALESVELSRCKVFEASAFSDCPNLKNINTEEIRYIGERCFAGCESLESVNLSKVGEIHRSAFEGAGVIDVNIPKAELLLNSAFEDCKRLRSVTIDGKISSLYPNAFKGCTALETVNLGKNIKTAGDGVFMSCENLKNINWQTIMYMPKDTFKGCLNLPMLDRRSEVILFPILENGSIKKEVQCQFYVGYKKTEDAAEMFEGFENLAKAVSFAKAKSSVCESVVLGATLFECDYDSTQTLATSDVTYLSCVGGQITYGNVADDKIAGKIERLNTEYPQSIRRIFDRHFYSVPLEKARFEKDFLDKNGIEYEVKEKNGLSVFAIANADKERYTELKSQSTNNSGIKAL